jgi:hypothetical protein
MLLPMPHSDELSSIEENRAAQSAGTLGRLAFKRVSQYLDGYINRYIARHPEAKIFLNNNSDDSVKMISVNVEKRACRFSCSDGQPTVLKVQGVMGSAEDWEVGLEKGSGTIELSRYPGPRVMSIQELVRDALNPILSHSA